MGDWKITGTDVDPIDTAAEILTFGFAPAPTTYTVENTETGETREVIAYSREGVGSKIADGKFSD